MNKFLYDVNLTVELNLLVLVHLYRLHELNVDFLYSQILPVQLRHELPELIGVLVQFLYERLHTDVSTFPYLQ